ncbi:MAG: 3'-5' exonuclease [Hydrogenophaga sp.]|jgi:DNA polymerase-3 subunit epsilon|nr:3'-5' exonuclease [Hydrogenophaga sp.]
MSQLTFEFEPSPERKAAPAVAARAQPLTPEDMAQLLAQHPDYRVLRRLVPVLDHGPAPVSSPAGVQRVLVLDTETTGLSHASDRIIELAMLLVQVDVATGQPFGPVETFEGFEDPGMPLPEVAKQVTGISDDMVRGHRLDEAKVQALIDRAHLVVAHNAGFDRPFVETRFPGFAHKAWACSFADIDWKALGAESAKLSALAQDQGWFYDAHRALVDCQALLQVLGQRVGDDGLNGLQRLLAAAARPSYKLRATGSPFDSKDKLKARGYRWDGEGKVWYCNLGSEAALADELAWLRAEVYSGRRAQVEAEALDALTRYSLRMGRMERREIQIS